ncbi:MAG: hypothetical protein E7052_03365 [Lentisphaerae bacterium]|nr:hypothetical protein [Lentisphaerota bacterium]
MEKNGFSAAARWITAPDCRGRKNCFVRFYRSFDLTEVPASFEIKITAESYYFLWVNNQAVTNGPVRGTVKLHYFDVKDIAEYLHCGENHLAVLVHNPGEQNFVATPGTDAPALLLELPNAVVSNESFKAQIAADYLNTEEYFAKQVGFMEDRNMTLAPDDRRWTRGLDGVENWPDAVAVEPIISKELTVRDIPELRVRRILPVDIVRTASVKRSDRLDQEAYKVLDSESWSDDAPERFIDAAALTKSQQHCTVLPAADKSGAAIILDLGQDYTGFTQIKISCRSAGALLYVTYGEALIEGNRIRINYRNPIYGFTDRYLLNCGVNFIGSNLCERGGRYIQLVFHDFTEPIVIDKVCFNEHRYDFGQAGSFFCSDQLLNRIWDICCETLQVCTSDVFTDCPWRERSFWVNDLIVENRTSLAAFGALDLHKRAFKLAFSQQRKDGWIPGVCPAPQEESLKWVLPATNLFLFLMLKDYCMASGDWATVEMYLPNLEKILQAVAESTWEDGTVAAPETAWHFYDWGFEFTDHSFRGQRESMFCFLYAAAIDIFLEFMQKCGKNCDQHDYRQRRDRAVAGAYLRFVDPKCKLLADDYRYYHYHENAPKTAGKVFTQLSHALAILYSDVPADLQKTFAAALADENLLKPDLYLQSFVLKALHKVQADDTALNRIRKYWGRVVNDGGKTVYENAVVKFAHELQECGCSGSLCHGFATAPLEFLQISTLGVTALEPGFRRFKFDPQPVDLEFAEGRVPTPQGNIFVKYKRNNKNLNVRLYVPDQCVAVLKDQQELPAGWHNLTIGV